MPIQQPESREAWFSENYFDPNGHQISRAGIAVNENFQVEELPGKVFDKRLYAAGIILANQDWIRQRCGAGIALAS